MSYHPYWTQRNARDKANKLLAAQTADRLWWARIDKAAVASVLPGYPIPASLERFPVIVHMPNGSRLVVAHLA